MGLGGIWNVKQVISDWIVHTVDRMHSNEEMWAEEYWYYFNIGMHILYYYKTKSMKTLYNVYWFIFKVFIYICIFVNRYIIIDIS